jgi:putative endonuclease
MAQHNETGTAGEKMAREYLVEKGFTILHQNWRHSHWEVDIIASKNNKLHFVEVKTRTSDGFGYPEDDVTKKKLRFLINSAEQYTYLNPQWKWIQFDILSITIKGDKRPDFYYIEDVYI